MFRPVDVTFVLTILLVFLKSNCILSWTPVCFNRSVRNQCIGKNDINKAYSLKRDAELARPSRSLRLGMSGNGGDDELIGDDDEEEDTEDNVTEEEDFSTSLDWGGAYGTLRRRIDDVKDGKSGPSYALFRMMTREGPNEAIGSLIHDASPEVITAMSGAVSALLGGLSNPAMGMDTVVKATSEKLSALCFQLQMTGYMFRNAEYVMALRDIMNIRSTSIQDYKAAFDRIDTDNSGYIEASEIEDLLEDVYGEQPPAFEVHSFLRFFDRNKDGRVSWKEFEKGLGAMGSDKAANAVARNMLALPGDMTDDDDEAPELKSTVSGIVEVELEDGTTVEIEAKDYIDGLKAEALALRQILAQEKGIVQSPSQNGAANPMPVSSYGSEGGSISSFIASLGEQNVRTLTEGISPAVMDAMKMLVNYVLDGGPDGNGKRRKDEELELPGSALQQLALWQLVLGYRLREAEATGEYRKMIG